MLAKHLDMVMCYLEYIKLTSEGPLIKNTLIYTEIRLTAVRGEGVEGLSEKGKGIKQNKQTKPC